jgi:hypothetical protein
MVQMARISDVSENFLKMTKKEQADYINEMQPKLCQMCVRDNCDGCHFQALTDVAFEKNLKRD